MSSSRSCRKANRRDEATVPLPNTTKHLTKDRRCRLMRLVKYNEVKLRYLLRLFRNPTVHHLRRGEIHSSPVGYAWQAAKNVAPKQFHAWCWIVVPPLRPKCLEGLVKEFSAWRKP